MTGADLLREAAAELYSSDPDEFVERRGALVARAREAGEAPAARQIAGMRKPTRSAWVINQLVCSAPAVTSELASLGDELRAAQGSLDGAAIRELSQRRRQLIESLARQAFTAAGLQSPPAALRDEVTATLGAALADPQVTEQMAAGTMARVAHRDGLGTPEAPELALVTPPGGRAKEVAGQVPGTRPAKMTAEERAQARAEAKARAAEEAAAARERRRQEALAEAEQAVAEADRSAEAAGAAEQELEDSVQQLEESLADARRRLTETRLTARRARNAQRSVRRELDRLRK